MAGSRADRATLPPRPQDSGLAVRKRVIKLLRTIYGTLSDPSLQAMIAIRLVERADDEDETVKVRRSARRSA